MFIFKTYTAGASDEILYEEATKSELLFTYFNSEQEIYGRYNEYVFKKEFSIVQVRAPRKGQVPSSAPSDVQVSLSVPRKKVQLRPSVPINKFSSSSKCSKRCSKCSTW